MTTSVPAGMTVSRAAISALSRRLVRLRTTAPPTALETTKPTRGGSPARASVCAEWTTTSGEPARAPPGPLSAAENSELVRSRCPTGSTGTTSGGELGAALGAAGRQDGAARTGPHPQAEAVGLGPATVVRLKSTLAHEVLRYWSGPVGLLSAGGDRTAAIGNPRRDQLREGATTGCHGHAKTADRPVPRYASANRTVKPARPGTTTWRIHPPLAPPRPSRQGDTPAQAPLFSCWRQYFRRLACSTGPELVSVRPRPSAVPTGCG